MENEVSLVWEELNGSWRGKRNDVVVALVVARASDGRYLWSLRTVNTYRIARSAGTAGTLEDAKECAQSSWDLWCRTLGLCAVAAAEMDLPRLPLSGSTSHLSGSTPHLAASPAAG